MVYKRPKGTFDILPEAIKDDDKGRESHRFAHIEEALRATSQAYGFSEIRTPIFESTDLFIRTVGEDSDIVSKEMYTFNDKGGRSMTLRPEGTAPALRAFIEHSLQSSAIGSKLFYIGPYFRYDRPQAGRFRQFHQYGVEAIGDTSPEQDVEVIDMILEIYRRLGLKELTLLINSLGTPACRAKYVSALKDYLQPHLADLSEDSQKRFETNPLRILDSKSKTDIEIVKGAPNLMKCLSEASKEHFNAVTTWLTRLKIPYQLTPTLVRGLDYYNQTVFEVTSNVLGAQNTIGAGGRYDGLIEQLGGPALPGIGFATGIERVLATMEGQNAPFPPRNHPKVALIPMGEAAEKALFPLTLSLRKEGIASTFIPTTKKLGKALSKAEGLKCECAIIVGEDELKKECANVKDLTQRQSEEIPLKTLLTYMRETYA